MKKNKNSKNINSKINKNNINIYKILSNQALFIILFIVLSFITVGYASVQTVLNLEGNATIDPYIVAKSGDSFYSSVQDAVNAAPVNTPTTIIMLQNSYEEIFIPSDKSILLSTDIYTIFSNGTGITNSGTLYFTGNLVSNANSDSISSTSGIKNLGVLYVSNSVIMATNENGIYEASGIENENYLSIENSNISGSTYGINSTLETSIVNIGNEESILPEDNSIITGEVYGINSNVFNIYGGTIKGKTNPGYSGLPNCLNSYNLNTRLDDGYYTSNLTNSIADINIIVTGFISGDLIQTEAISNEHLIYEFESFNDSLDDINITYCIDKTNNCTPSNIYNKNEINKISEDGTWYIRYVGTNSSGVSSEVKAFVATIDTTGPRIKLDSSGNDIYQKSHIVNINISDEISGIASNAIIKYGWSLSNTVEPDNYVTVALDYMYGEKTITFEATNDVLNGQYYLWIVPEILKDTMDNNTEDILISENKFYFDNEAPIIESVTASGVWASAEKITVTATDNDEISGYLLTTSSEIPSLTTEGWQTDGEFTVSENKTWYAWAKDKVGNISNYSIITNSHVCLEFWDVSKNQDESIYGVLLPNYELLITGVGETIDYSNTEDRPYNKYIESITSIVVDEGVTSLGNRFFQNMNSAKTISLPSTLTSITYTTFERTTSYNEDGIIIADQNNNFVFENSTLYDKNKTIIYTHSRNDTSTNFTIPSTVTFLSYGSFYQNTNLESVNISSNLDIGWSVFRGCSSLEVINSTVGNTTINGTVGNTRISPYSFDNTNLSNIKIGKNVITFMKSGTTYYPIEGVTGTIYYYGSNEEVNAYLENTDDNITWKAIATVTLDPNGGSIEKNSIEAVYEENYGSHTTLPIPTREGYTFLGWYTSKTEGIKVDESTSTVQKTDHTLYARWAKSIDSSDITIDLSSSEYIYDGMAKMPSVTVKNGSINLINGVHYNVTYSNNINAGEAIITITAIESLDQETGILYTGTVNKKFVIHKADFTGGSVTLNGDFTYGSNISSNIINPEESPTEYRYQWYINSTNSTTGGTKIEGATASTLTVKDEEFNNYIYLVVTAIKDNYNNKEIVAVSSTKVGKRSINVTAGSASKIYDGTELSSNDCSSNDLLDFHSISCVMDSSSTIINAGSVNNTINSVSIKNDSDNSDVSAYYDVTYVSGVLTIEKADPVVTLSTDSGTISYDSEGTFVANSSVDGTWEINSSASSYVTATIDNTIATANTDTNITYNGLKYMVEPVVLTLILNPNSENYNSVEKKFTVNLIDLVIPTINIDSIKSGDSDLVEGNWASEDIVVNLSGNDTGSGIDYFEWREEGSSSWQTDNISTNGTNATITFSGGLDTIVYFRVKDVAGNYSMELDTPIKLDTVNPTAIISVKDSVSGEDIENDTWNKNSLSIELSGTAGPSGLSAIKYCIDTTNECTPSETYTTAFTHSISGTRYIRYAAINGANKMSDINYYIAKIDNDPPEIKSSGTLTIYLKEAIDKTYNLCKGITISDSSGNITCTNSMVTNSEAILSEVGTYTINYLVKDIFGNETTYSRSVKVIANATTLSYSGGQQTYSVASTGSYTIELYGAAGGTLTCNTSRIGTGGNGGYIKGTIKLNAGDQLFVYIGGAGSGYTKGYNGGGAGGGTALTTGGGGGAGGGGATDVRKGGTALSNRILVAGGGGGGSCDSGKGQSANGGAGGSTTGASGTTFIKKSGYTATVTAAEGGTQSAGGAATAISITSPNAHFQGTAGSLGNGGNCTTRGAGGGGGYYGGGAGSLASKYNSSGSSYVNCGGSAAGGSSYASSSFTSVSHTQGSRTGNGTAIITFIGN